ncbi:hypothetical protein [Dolichospermum sp. UHCC 0315A]|uniref:hypothetical protein n=1 Tax=Dolichospermum sp. UHCC 0315A TaxID=1914871 RepID=UPI00143DADE6|nr:hypothetical protein [Dolichospermum sp. UHCC 0315A]
MSNDAARKETRPAIAGSYVMINEPQLQSRAFNSIKIVRCQLSVVRCSLSVGAKHLEDKLSVIAKIVLQMLRPYSCSLSVVRCFTNDQ